MQKSSYDEYENWDRNRYIWGNMIGERFEVNALPMPMTPPDCERFDVFVSLIVSGERLGPFRVKHNDTVGNLKDMLIESGVGGPPRAQAKPEAHPEPDHSERFRQAD